MCVCVWGGGGVETGERVQKREISERGCNVFELIIT